MKILEHLLDVLLNGFLHVLLAAMTMIAPSCVPAAKSADGREAAAIAGPLDCAHGAAAATSGIGAVD